jgi:hypothetical protein
MKKVASFGFELVNLNGNGANAYFPIANSMTLDYYNIDAALMLVSPTTGGFAEVLCKGQICRGGPPTFTGAPDYPPYVQSGDFGQVSYHNPQNLNLIGNGGLNQDVFYSVILKSVVPPDGTASATHRQVSASPSLTLNAGDYLVFHMDHAGVSVDCEMQVVLGYTLL